MVKPDTSNQTSSHALEVFLAFLKLGCTSFGGPVAHLGYFRTEFVERRQWLGEQQFAQLLAICQFLPGPASSQLGFAIGLLRAGWRGALLAFVGFTAPSVILLLIFAASLSLFANPFGDAAIHGLKLVACAVVADAVLGMAKKLCPDIARRMMAVLVLAVLLVWATTTAQLLMVLLAAVAGVGLLRNSAVDNAPVITVNYGPRVGIFWLSLFACLLFGLPLVALTETTWAIVADIFYRAGALVFGGGHVVLPLLQSALVEPGALSAQQFLAGYGAAQALPGPLFSYAAFLGVMLAPEGNIALITASAVIFIFLPGFLLLVGVLPLWSAIARSRNASRALAGINAAVVGLLAATLYNPILTSAIMDIGDLFIALVAFGLLVIGRVSPLLVVLWCVLASVVRLSF